MTVMPLGASSLASAFVKPITPAFAAEYAGEETISVYGISPDSRYWKGLNIGDGHVVFGGGLLDKFGWSEGQKVP